MRNVRLRLATEEEGGKVRQFLDRDDPLLECYDSVAFEHEEGVGYVVAGMMFVRWEREPSAISSA